MRGLKGKNVLVTGSSSGIGQAIAVRFAQYGANVAINYVKQPEEAHDTDQRVHACTAKVRAEGVRDVLVGGDVSDEQDVVRMVAATVEQLGGLGRTRQQRGDPDLQAVRGALERRLRQSHQRQPARCVHVRARVDPSLPGQRRRRDPQHLERSPADPQADYLGYSVSKGGLQNLTRTLALEYAGRGIRVNDIDPGATITPINSASIDDPVKKEQVESHIPMARAGTADEMAGVTCFLASDDGAYITGQTLFVDGGLTLYPSFREPWSSE
jgi:glucose 1-dehydrogenase